MLPNSSFVSFIIGVIILAYLSTFVVFAIVRIIWGISIQRLWWSGLRHISYTPRDGIRIDIRGLHLSFHRPTFSQPTWISVVITELKITVDVRALGSKRVRKSRWSRWADGYGSPPESPAPVASVDPEPEPESDTDAETEIDGELSEGEDGRSRTWERLTQIKERIKRLHRKIDWIRAFDLVATNSCLEVLEVGSLQISHFTVAVDTRTKTVDRSRLFQHREPHEDYRKPAEWIFTGRSLLFSPDGHEFTEILDNATLNIHGMLSQKLEGLRDASIALKFGRLRLPYDDLRMCVERIKRCRKAHSRHSSRSSQLETSFADIIEELDQPGSKEESIVQTVSDSKEFIASILRGIQEIQFAVSYVGMSKRIESVQSKGAPVYLNMSMKEIGLDLLRLDPRSPAHVMYFSPGDVAHQALVTAISLSVGIDDGHDHPERLLYIPLATATLKTTLPSKAIQMSKEKNAAQRNSNILSANLVVTSPSIDLDPKHLPLTIAILETRQETQKPSGKEGKHHLISRLLPKASIKVSIHEPVARVSLPCMEVERRGTGEFDLLISAMSSMSLDVESSHSSTGDLHYTLSSTYRVSNHQLYYQTASGEKHKLLVTDSLELKVQVSASPTLAVVASGDVRTFSIFMIRPEISEGVRQIVVQLHRDASRRGRSSPDLKTPSFLRRLPYWLHQVHFEGSDINFEVAGVDSSISDHARGASLHLESWTAEYKADKTDDTTTKHVRRRATSRSLQGDDIFLKPTSPGRKQASNSTDGRRLTVHAYGLEAYAMESADAWEIEPFLSVPRFEIALSTLTDQKAPVLHINSFARNVYLHYSLYRHFACGIALLVLRKTFSPPHSERNASLSALQSRSKVENPRPTSPGAMSNTEAVVFDFRSSLIQLKATMPAEPNMMLQLFSLETGKKYGLAPFAKVQLARLYADTPKVRHAWSRIISLRALRFDYRNPRRKYGNSFIEERHIDIATEAIRVAVPHQLVVHKIFDNITNVLKTIEQLHHRFKTGTPEYILVKKPQAPKLIPKISLRSQAVLFEIEDSSFEWKLGLIYVQGLHEQKQRLARAEAFRLKIKKIEEMDAAMTSRRETYEAKEKRGWHRRARHKRRASEDDFTKQRSKSAGDSHLVRETSPRRPASRRLRYDGEGTCVLSETAQRSIMEAEESLCRFNAKSWKKRIDNAYHFQQERMREIHSVVWGLDEVPEGIEQRERIMAIPQRPALMAVMVHGFEITIDKPSFPLHEYPNFMHRIGKKMPVDMEYSLLIPMHVKISMHDARSTMRDYPLPFIHIPPIRSGQSVRNPSLILNTDFIIAEEYRSDESIRHAKVVVVPPDRAARGERSKGLSVDVRRTVGAVKTYSDIAMDVHTGSPTRITWGASYQPVIQDMMQVVESFLKPPIDPSQRVGFWDKIRLSFHSRINVAWKGDGDVHLVLKGSRDPYHVTGSGAGFVMCWRNNVRWSICQDDDPRKFMTVRSGEYVLAIPDFSQYATQALGGKSSENSRIASTSSYDQGGKFQKTVMKLSGNVQWLVGLVFERNTTSGGRSFNFRHHYDIVLKNPKYAKAVDGLEYDAFRGFRSHHIHLSVAIAAPVDRDWTVTNLKPSSNYNSVHLTPRFFSHFFSWWSMFSGNLSLPVRQGRLWPGADKTSKKFGRHLATIKYNLLLSPLYISHIYKNKGPDEQGQNCIFATGLKVKLDSFMLDLHQRREEFRKQVQGNKQTKTSGVHINKAQLDLIAADFRAISATIKETTISDIDDASDEVIALYEDHIPKADLSNFTIPDNDTGWVDMDDFVELDWILPVESTPETHILPLAFAPRFTYFRQTDHHNIISGDPNRSSPFGNEPTHYCVMSARNDPRRVQCDLIQGRLDRISEQLSQQRRSIGELELKAIRQDSGDQDIRSRIQEMQDNHDILLRKQAFLQSMHSKIIRRLEDNDARATPDVDGADDEFFEAKEEFNPEDPDLMGPETPPSGDDISDFNNRFIIHNVQLKWSNSLRNIIFRYIHQVSQRRGFVYYMSRRAVKFILDIVEEQHKVKESASRQSMRDTEPTTPISFASPSGDKEVQDRIQQLLDDGKRFVTEAESDEFENQTKPSGPGDHGDEISREFTAQNSYHVRLIAPQIQLQSEKNTKSAVLVTAQAMQLKVIQIMDKDRVTDEVSGLVQRRFNATMDSVQMFVTSSKTFSSDSLDLYSANRYGARAGSSWPPWVPLEDMFDFHVDPYGFSRVVQRTSASMRYDKFNTLRLKYNDAVTAGQSEDSDDENMENRMDHIWVDFPQLLTKCNSTQWYALYIIVVDLLLWNEPLEKTREEKLEKIMLASDFSDLSPAPDMVIKLQEKIRTLQEIKLMFQLHESTLTRRQWRERVTLENDLAQREDELFFIMKAITTSQRRYDDRLQSEQATGNLRWEIAASELVWHMVRGLNESLIELQLKDAHYLRTDNTDGSNDNTMEIGKIEGWTLLPNATYPQLIAPFDEGSTRLNESVSSPMVRIHWYMLEAVAGIAVTERFEVNIFPLRIQLEYDTWVTFFEYLFPNISSGKSDNVEFSPFMIKHMLPTHREENEDEEDESSPTERNWEHQATNGEYVENLTGSGDLELRLKPTLTLPDSKGPKSPRKSNTPKGSQSDISRLRHFTHSDGHDLRKLTARRKDTSSDSIAPGFTRALSHRSNLSDMSRKDTDTPKRFALLRTNSSTSAKKAARNNDLTEMLGRASKYMTLTYVNIESMVLCLSYKGKGNRNLVTDLHDLVFRLPTQEFRNKTWSTLDLVNNLKKEVIKTLVGHTGAIIGNKFRDHRYSKSQQSKLREMANSSIVLGSNSNITAKSFSESTSTRRLSLLDEDEEYDEDKQESSEFPRSSFASGRRSEPSRDAESMSGGVQSTSHADSNGNQESPSGRPRTASSAIRHSRRPPSSSHSSTPYATPSPSRTGDSERRPSSLRRLTGTLTGGIATRGLSTGQGTAEDGKEEPKERYV